MASTSADRVAQELLDHCLAGRPWPEQLLDSLVDEGGNHALFRIVVERLGDLFEPHLCLVYANLFADVIARRIPSLHTEHLVQRYERVRIPRTLDRDPSKIRNVFVLSRVTLGADVAVTSILLDAAKKCFPAAQVHFVGPQKSWELFAADPRIRHLPIVYGRGGTLDGRLSVWPELRDAVSQPNSIVIDPDSRLTQLGLLPICPEEDYYFFESRSFGGDGADSLPMLARRWAERTLGVADAHPYIETGLDAATFAATVSFGVGENLNKRVADPFEPELLRMLPRPLLIDKGVGGDEAQRVDRAVAAAEGQKRGVIVMWEGSFAGFAAHVQKSRLYAGYDSSGGHVAAACGIPLLSVFSGFVSERMFDRWRPSGDGPIRVIRAGNFDVAALLNHIAEQLPGLLASRG